MLLRKGFCAMHPSPNFSPVEERNLRLMHAIDPSYLALRFFAFERQNFENLGRSKLRPVIPLSKLMSSMEKFVFLVLTSRLPRQVALGDAARISTSVSCLMLRRRRRSVNLFAQMARGALASAADVNNAVSSYVTRIWPHKALVSVIWENGFFEESHSLTAPLFQLYRWEASKLAKASVMSIAVSTTEVPIAAVRYRAGAEYGHSEVLRNG